MDFNKGKTIKIIEEIIGLQQFLRSEAKTCSCVWDEQLLVQAIRRRRRPRPTTRRRKRSSSSAVCSRKYQLFDDTMNQLHELLFQEEQFVHQSSLLNLMSCASSAQSVHVINYFLPSDFLILNEALKTYKYPPLIFPF